jgi:hypothetical protein
MQRIGDLEINQDLRFQERMWVAQRAGWIGMLAIAVVALLGFIGHGPLTGGTAGSAGGLEVDYARFARHRADTELVFTAHPAVIADGQVQLGINAEYLEGLEVRGILPEPESVSIDARWVTYSFQVADASQPVRITFNIAPIKDGLHTMKARIGTAEPLEMRQLVYP